MDKVVLLELYPGYTSVLGPYKRSDGRKHVILNNSNLPKKSKGKLRTISYPKALVEINRKARLQNNETIDHVDRNFLNDDLLNLEVKNRRYHASEDALRVEVFDVNCLGCGFEFTPSKDQRNAKKDIAGPFCSSQCSGIYGKLVQIGNKKLLRDEITKIYDRLDK